MTPHTREELLQTQINSILQLMLVYSETQETITEDSIQELLSDASEENFKRLGIEGRPGSFYQGLTYSQLMSIIEPSLNVYSEFLDELYDDFYYYDVDELECEPEEIPESDTNLSDIIDIVQPK